ncbi:hypothetical protein HFN80_17015 [Rhizobium laguerreae]|uniref:hypothetical protein n=1 Tax=Rhizobium laguerreae TaxID=1076926 RepID=UPI001C90EC42|nr:hypothetical protein [Rhizobium laguerreae]MBY3465694.1 hypothetical protein [Rhizobium laguerreae]
MTSTPPVDLPTWARNVANKFLNWVTRDKFVSILLLGGVSLLGSNIAVILAAAGRVFNPGPPVPDPSFGMGEWVGLGLIALGSFTKAYLGRRADRNAHFDASIRLFRAFGTMAPGEKQVEFEMLKGVKPTATVIDVLLSHPQNPAGVVDMYVLGARHVEPDGNWFRLKSRRHRFKKSFAFALFTAFSLWSLLSLVGGSVIIGTAPGMGDRAILGGQLILQALLVGIAAAGFLKDYSRYANAEQLVRERP